MFPHQLSGGMKQRACIAIAMSLSPRVIVADEPTSALDVVVQRQVMDTLARAQTELGAAVILVGHDMGLMAQFVDRLGVMYAGRLVEISPVRDVFTDAAPSVHADADRQPAVARAEGASSRASRGFPPPLRDLPAGCAFHPRCPLASTAAGREVARAPRGAARTRWAACHLRVGHVDDTGLLEARAA